MPRMRKAAAQRRGAVRAARQARARVFVRRVSQMPAARARYALKLKREMAMLHAAVLYASKAQRFS